MIKVKSKLIILLKSIINILISFKDILSRDQNFLFKSNYVVNLNNDKDVFIYVVDLNIKFV